VVRKGQEKAINVTLGEVPSEREATLISGTLEPIILDRCDAHSMAAPGQKRLWRPFARHVRSTAHS
jgi:hypothetical protein